MFEFLQYLLDGVIELFRVVDLEVPGVVVLVLFQAPCLVAAQALGQTLRGADLEDTLLGIGARGGYVDPFHLLLTDAHVLHHGLVPLGRALGPGRLVLGLFGRGLRLLRIEAFLLRIGLRLFEFFVFEF